MQDLTLLACSRLIDRISAKANRRFHYLVVSPIDRGASTVSTTFSISSTRFIAPYALALTTMLVDFALLAHHKNLEVSMKRCSNLLLKVLNSSTSIPSNRVRRANSQIGGADRRARPVIRGRWSGCQ
ncbi:MAG: hypothetical protein R3B74_08720 [Nitrospirales bacterium]|nr:hypothetical protein [Nitrospirales bacterium]